MVGIGGGVPSAQADVRLGDVVILLPGPEQVEPRGRFYRRQLATREGRFRGRLTKTAPQKNLALRGPLSPP
jgi:hypothetical protein